MENVPQTDTNCNKTLLEAISNQQDLVVQTVQMLVENVRAMNLVLHLHGERLQTMENKAKQMLSRLVVLESKSERER